MSVRRILWGLMLVICTVLWADGESPADLERESLTKPSVIVALLAASDFSPVLGTLVGNRLYYASESTKAPCSGKDLYSIDLAAPSQLEVKVAQMECVEDLHTDGTRLYATVHLNKKREILQWTEKGWLSLFQGDARWNAAFHWRRHQAQTATGLPWFSENPDLRYFSVSEFSPVSLVFSLASVKRSMFFQYTESGSQRRGNSRALQFAFDVNPGNAVGFGADREGRFYLPLSAKGGDPSYRVMVASLDNPAEAFLIGGDTPYSGDTIWDQLPVKGEDAWYLRSARVVSAKHGVLIHGTTEYQNEWNAIAYYRAGDSHFRRVRLSPEIVDGVVGVSLARGGMVISRPARKQILYVGKQSVFDPKRFLPRDLHLRVIEEEEKD